LSSPVDSPVDSPVGYGLTCGLPSHLCPHLWPHLWAIASPVASPLTCGLTCALTCGLTCACEPARTYLSTWPVAGASTKAPWVGPGWAGAGPATWGSSGRGKGRGGVEGGSQGPVGMTWPLLALEQCVDLAAPRGGAAGAAEPLADGLHPRPRCGFNSPEVRLMEYVGLPSPGHRRSSGWKDGVTKRGDDLVVPGLQALAPVMDNVLQLKERRPPLDLR
ncbi:unnamed protein product, partial [Gadus morhua 'NCC']